MESQPHTSHLPNFRVRPKTDANSGLFRIPTVSEALLGRTPCRRHGRFGTEVDTDVGVVALVVEIAACTSGNDSVRSVRSTATNRQEYPQDETRAALRPGLVLTGRCPQYCSARDLRVGGLVENRRGNGRFVCSRGLVSAMGGIIFAQYQGPARRRRRTSGQDWFFSFSMCSRSSFSLARAVPRRIRGTGSASEELAMLRETALCHGKLQVRGLMAAK